MKKYTCNDLNNRLTKFYLSRLIQNSFNKISLLESSCLKPLKNSKSIYSIDFIKIELISSFMLDKAYLDFSPNLMYIDNMFKFNLRFSIFDIFSTNFNVGLQEIDNLKLNGIAIFSNQSLVSLPILYLEALIISFDYNILKNNQIIIFDKYNKLQNIKFKFKKIDITTENNFVFRELFGQLSTLFHYKTPN